MKRTIVLLAALIMLMGMATAQEQQTPQQQEGLVNTVIITSVDSPQDTVIASGPAKKLGIPILHVEKDSVPEPTSEALRLLQPENVVVIGGPEVINPDLESELGNYSDSTTRLWGTTATETSTRVSEYYWPEGSNQTAIVHTAEQRQLNELIGIVQEVETGKPVLISDGDNISADVLTEIERLNTDQVNLYSTQTEDFDISSLRDITNVELQQGPLEQLLEIFEEERINQITENIGSDDTLVLAAGQEETGRIVTTPYLTDTYFYGVQTEAQIDSAVRLVQQVQTEDIWVTGNPELVNDVETIVEDTTGKEVRVIEGDQFEISEQIIRRKLSTIATVQEQLYQPWMEQIQNSTEMQISANTQLTEARNVVDQNSPQQAQDRLNQAEAAYNQNNWFEARTLAVQAASQARIDRYTELLPSIDMPQENETEGILS